MMKLLRVLLFTCLYVPVIATAHMVPGTMPDMAIGYPPSCCNSAATSPTGDCAPIDDQYVREEADGYHVDLPVGAHPKLMTKAYHGVIPYKDAYPKPIDNRYHICLATDGIARYCFFPKPGAV